MKQMLYVFLKVVKIEKRMRGGHYEIQKLLSSESFDLNGQILCFKGFPVRRKALSVTSLLDHSVAETTEHKFLLKTFV